MHSAKLENKLSEFAQAVSTFTQAVSTNACEHIYEEIQLVLECPLVHHRAFQRSDRCIHSSIQKIELRFIRGCFHTQRICKVGHRTKQVTCNQCRTASMIHTRLEFEGWLVRLLTSDLIYPAKLFFNRPLPHVQNSIQIVQSSIVRKIESQIATR